jgi:hypothetical protein
MQITMTARDFNISLFGGDGQQQCLAEVCVLAIVAFVLAEEFVGSAWRKCSAEETAE